MCGARCVNLQTDNANCGACGTACGAGQSCAAGACVITSCPSGQTLCSGRCVDANSDLSNCGACGTACPPRANATASCSGGACGFACGAGWGDCDSSASNGCETNTLSNDSNCGACGRACGPGDNCRAGSCLPIICPGGTFRCAGTCMSFLNSDPSNCGACGYTCGTAHTTSVSCRTGTCNLTCATDYANCDGSDANGCETSTGSGATSNCGACGNVCPTRPNIIAPTCVGGSCGYFCASGFRDCNGAQSDGCEVTTATLIPPTAAACGMGCPTPANASRTCVSGSCGYACGAGWGDCDGSASNGCETNLQTSSASCGACGRACSSGNECRLGTCLPIVCPGGTFRCAGTCMSFLNSDAANCGACGSVCGAAHTTSVACRLGTCNLTCATDYANCDGSDTNGCETSTGSGATSNCGACGNVCPTRPNIIAPTCVGGYCGYLCSSGFRDCNGTQSDGCEVNYYTDPANCGGCGMACPTPANASRTCASGSCGLACNSGWGNCDGSASNGCETNIISDRNNCGACGSVCPTYAHATSGCDSGFSCTMVCDADYANCDGSRTNGCETFIGNGATSNCGACGNACASRPNTIAPTCLGGYCGYFCASGFRDCNGAQSDGCEVNYYTDPANCGGCGMSCPTPANASRTCSGGSCGYSCNSGYRDCNGAASDGCEVNTTSSASNCGGCGTTCAPALRTPTGVCSSGSCSLACNSGWGNCDGSASNGCETNIISDRNNCGACGSVCPTYAHATSGCDFGFSCTMVCDAGYANCDGSRTNGCETFIGNGATSNCGACGNVCASRPNTIASTCVGGYCGYFCSSGFRDCNGAQSDGCEVNYYTDPANCGGCGMSCPTPANASRTCTDGSCGYACNSGYCDVDRSASNGCETAIHTQHACSSCGDDCGTGRCTRLGITSVWTCL